MTGNALKNIIKDIVGNFPFVAKAVWNARKKKGTYTDNPYLEKFRPLLAQAVQEAQKAAPVVPVGPKKVFLFSTLGFWVAQTSILGLVLKGLGYDVTLGYVPDKHWKHPLNKFDQRVFALELRDILAPMNGFMRLISLLDVKPDSHLPDGLLEAVDGVSIFDAQYTDQIEDVDTYSDFFRQRRKRNRFAAKALLRLWRENPPDVVVIPNGTILEFGAAYQTAKALNIPVVTYEFGDQREQIWIAQNDQVMRQNTDLLWAARGATPLTNAQKAKIEGLQISRMGGHTFGKSTRVWQDVATQGGEKTRSALGLDERPVVLLTTNVLGDSLTLGRNVFSSSMAEWLGETVRYFAKRDDVQLVIRIHPGERFARGTSMLDVARNALPELPAHISLIGPLEKINTYDLMEIAQLGLTFTTTGGLEMAMRGIPVIASGETHFRKRGFTFDPASWAEYFSTLETLLPELTSKQLTPKQVDLAWRYAYLFFFEYPLSFPWKLPDFLDNYQNWTVEHILSAEGRARFEETFHNLAGKTIDWKPQR